jgi:hypothetical protein
MQTFSLTTLGLWTGLEDWPHRACVDAVVTEMHAQLYSAQSIYQRRGGSWPGALTRWALPRSGMTRLIASSSIGGRRALSGRGTPRPWLAFVRPWCRRAL